MTAGDVLLLKFPFSDLSGAKLRPVLVLALADRDEYIFCQITSQRRTDRRAIELTDDSFDEGGLRKSSFVRPTKMFTAHRSRMIRRVGRLKDNVKSAVREAVIQLIRKGL